MLPTHPSLGSVTVPPLISICKKNPNKNSRGGTCILMGATEVSSPPGDFEGPRTTFPSALPAPPHTLTPCPLTSAFP